MSKKHTFIPRDAKGNEFGVEIIYEFEPAQLERGQFGRREDATPPFPASVTINRVMVVEGDIMEFLDSVDINWGVIEEEILSKHDES